MDFSRHGSDVQWLNSGSNLGGHSDAAGNESLPQRIKSEIGLPDDNGESGSGHDFSAMTVVVRSLDIGVMPEKIHRGMAPRFGEGVASAQTNSPEPFV